MAAGSASEHPSARHRSTRASHEEEVAQTSSGHKVLVVNCGSSSVKYQLMDPTTGDVAASGLIERLRSPEAVLHHHLHGDPSRASQVETFDLSCAGATNHEALAAMVAAFDAHGPSLSELVAIGHRVVHGGDRYDRPTLIDQDVLTTIRLLTPLAPLHNPVNAEGIEAMQQLRPKVPQVAVFDTAFHATLPPEAYTYPLAADVSKRWQIRRYGFHGTSVAYVSRAAAEFLGRPPDEVDLVVAHLGNGASITLVQRGRSVDTTMGFSPLEGLMMGTRVGDLDASVPLYLQREAGMSGDDVDRLMNQRSGLLGVAGASDMRTVLERADAGDADADLARAIYCRRITKYLGAFRALAQHLDAVVFTGGIGENAAPVRARACADLAHIGIRLDPRANEAAVRAERINAVDDGTLPVRVLVVPTDEELEIARAALEVVTGQVAGIPSSTSIEEGQGS